jgi:hypothetical protein
MTFSMYYTLDVDTDRRLMIEKIYGTWKRETAESYHRDFMETAQPLIGGKWAKIINLTNWKSSYPEMVEVIGRHLRWCRENGMVLSVNIIDNQITKNQLKQMFRIGNTGRISKIVRSQQEADKILAEHGF